MTDDNQPLRVALYLRVSTDDQADKYGLDLQRAAIEALVKSKGQFSDGSAKAILAGEQYVYIDDGISGTRETATRPGFTRLMEDLLNAPDGEKPFDVVAVYRIDRFARKLKILINVLEYFEKNGIKILSANESIDTSTPFGRAILGIIGVIAELEIETMKQRTQDGRKQAANKGVVMGENALFGYHKNPDKTPAIFEYEAKVVRQIFYMFVTDKLTPQQIADELLEQQILSPTASAIYYQKRKGEPKKKNEAYFWRDHKVREILSNEAYIGTHYFNKTRGNIRLPKTEWTKSDFVYPRIIDKLTFQMAQNRLDKLKVTNTNVTRASKNQHIYLLSGLLRCEECLAQQRTDVMPSWVGEPRKVSTSKGDSISYLYKCGRRNPKKFSETCNTIPLPATQVEQIVLDQVRQLLDNPEPVIKYQNKLKSNVLEKENLLAKQNQYIELINKTPERKERLKEQHQAGIIPSITELKEKLTVEDNNKIEWEQKISDIDRKIGKITLTQQYADVFAHFQKKYQETLGDLEKNRKFTHDLLESLLDKVVVRSRPVTEKDIISGRKKPNQAIPYKLDLYFRLPKDMLQELFFKFGVKDADL